MKKLCKIMALLLTLAMSVSMLAACGGGDSGKGAAGGTDVDPASLQFPLKDKAEISGLTVFSKTAVIGDYVLSVCSEKELSDLIPVFLTSEDIAKEENDL